MAQIREIGRAPRDRDGVKLILSLLQRRDGLVLDQRGNGVGCIAVKDSVRLAGKSRKAGALGLQHLIIRRDNIVSRRDIVGNVLVLPRRQRVKIQLVVFHAYDLPVTVLCAFHAQTQRKRNLGHAVPD